MTMYVRNGGVWKTAIELNVRDGGVWKPAQTGLVRDAGVWKPFHQRLMTAHGPFSNTNRLQNTINLPAFFPLTFACWATANAEGDCWWGIGQTGNDQYRHYASGYTSRVLAQTRDGGSNTTAISGYYPKNETWFHVATVFASTTDKRAFLNGGTKGINTQFRNPGTNRARMCIGTNAAATYPWDAGYISHVGIWTAALGDAEIADLAAGAKPSDVNAANLYCYLPMTGADPRVVAAGNGSPSWSINGTIPQTANVPGPI